MKYCFGVDIGGTSVKLALFNSEEAVVSKWEVPTNTLNEGEAILPDILSSIEEKMQEFNVTRENIIGIGVGVPAPVLKSGIVNGSANLGWKYKEVKREMEEYIGVPVYVGNDANVAALGEMWKGGGMGYQNIIMVTLGTGVGGGLINEGTIISGAHGAGGEIGHLCVNYQEEDHCGCGKTGCLEQYSSATGIVRLAKKRLAKDQKASSLRNLEVTAKDVFDAVKAGDEVACEIANEVAQYLGHALANLAVITDPEAIVIGGGVSRAGDVLVELVEKYYKEKQFFANTEVQFLLATLGNDAGVYGAAKLVF